MPSASKRKPRALRPYDSYSVGDWIIPRDQNPRRPRLYRAKAFSGNFVHAEHFGTSEVFRLIKADHTRATEADVGKVIAWRLKGGKW